MDDKRKDHADPERLPKQLLIYDVLTDDLESIYWTKQGGNVMIIDRPHSSTRSRMDAARGTVAQEIYYI